MRRIDHEQLPDNEAAEIDYSARYSGSRIASLVAEISALDDVPGSSSNAPTRRSFMMVGYTNRAPAMSLALPNAPFSVPDQVAQQAKFEAALKDRLLHLPPMAPAPPQALNPDTEPNITYSHSPRKHRTIRGVAGYSVVTVAAMALLGLVVSESCHRCGTEIPLLFDQGSRLISPLSQPSLIDHRGQRPAIPTPSSRLINQTPS